MDAPNPSTIPAFASRAPLHVGGLGLVVRDLDKVAGFYRGVLGLDVIEHSDRHMRLGAGGVVFLELNQRSGIEPDDEHTAGLYHTAFLMPTRADLARWVMRIAENRVPITGASDHGVSEAFYLDDPEGNGVEVYSDRPPEAWNWVDGLVNMPTKALDMGALVAVLGKSRETYQSAPAGLRIGHVHLRVGDLAPAERFYRQGIGLDLTRKRNGAAFMSTGRYHHHVAANIWLSAGAGKRDQQRAGLDWFALEATDPAMLDAIAARLREQGAPVSDRDDGIETSDPWGTRLRIVRG